MAMLKVPGLRSLGLKISGSFLRKGLRNLVRMAEERAGTVPAAGTRDASSR
jgi:hypothetical protein